jgi:hypothetical protein
MKAHGKRKKAHPECEIAHPYRGKAHTYCEKEHPYRGKNQSDFAKTAVLTR